MPEQQFFILLGPLLATGADTAGGNKTQPRPTLFRLAVQSFGKLLQAHSQGKTSPQKHYSGALLMVLRGRAQTSSGSTSKCPAQPQRLFIEITTGHRAPVVLGPTVYRQPTYGSLPMGEVSAGSAPPNSNQPSPLPSTWLKYSRYLLRQDRHIPGRPARMAQVKKFLG